MNRTTGAPRAGLSQAADAHGASSRARSTALGLLAFAGFLAACGSPPPPPPMAAPAPPASSAPPVAARPIDPLGPKPEVPKGAAFVPPLAEAFDGPLGTKVWLLERHDLPLVSVLAVTPYGSGLEPSEEAGLAHLTASLLDEGAGKRDSVTFAAALDALGARLSSSNDRDSSVVSLEVLSARLPEALALFGDALVRPRHDARDFKRIHGLWQNELKARGDDPSDVARVATSAAYFGTDHPYGRPVEGTLTSSARVTLAKAKAFHQTIWRPDAVTFVIVGDVKKADVGPLLEKSLGAWKAPAKAPLPTVVAPVLAPRVAKPEASGKPRAVLVVREGAPQVVMSVARRGVAAADPTAPGLALVNTILGGSFTSRLNQSLREDHGWSYGARSRFNLQRGTGLFVARAAVRTDAISPALKETLRIVKDVAQKGIAADELSKAQKQIDQDTVSAYGTLRGIAFSLASNVGLGLGVDADRTSLAAQMSAKEPALAAAAKEHLTLDDDTVLVFVGPKAAVEQALRDNELPPPELRDADGNKTKAD
jgi:zinc protease